MRVFLFGLSPRRTSFIWFESEYIVSVKFVLAFHYFYYAASNIYIRCSIACLCLHLPSSPESLHLSLMGFPYSEMAIQTLAYGLPPLWFPPPLGVPTMLHESLSESHDHSSIDGTSPLVSNRESNSATGISLIRRSKVCKYHWWD